MHFANIIKSGFEVKNNTKGFGQLFYFYFLLNIIDNSVSTKQIENKERGMQVN